MELLQVEEESVKLNVRYYKGKVGYRQRNYGRSRNCTTFKNNRVCEEPFHPRNGIEIEDKASKINDNLNRMIVFKI